MSDIRTSGHEFHDEDGNARWSPGYQCTACLICVAEAVRYHGGAMGDVSFIHGAENGATSCGRHGEPLADRAYHDASPDFGEAPSEYA